MHGLQQPERELLGIVEEALDLHQVEENANEAARTTLCEHRSIGEVSDPDKENACVDTSARPSSLFVPRLTCCCRGGFGLQALHSAYLGVVVTSESPSISWPSPSA